MRADRVVFAQVPLLRSQLDALKRRAGASTTKDALQAAVDHYLCCTAIEAAAQADEPEEQVGGNEWWRALDRRSRT